jgi:hypothetical protein
MNTFNQINQGNSEQVPMGVVQHNLENIFPSASEIGNLWACDLAENMAVCMLKYMVAKSKDPDIKPVLQQALDFSTQRINSIETLFNSTHHPIPEGFGEKDVDINAPELFSEGFSLAYTRLMNVFIELKYSMALARSSRQDFRQFFSQSIDTSREISQRATDILLAKGLFAKAPHIIIPDRNEIVEDKNYYGSIFGGKRPLNALEISHLFHNMEVKLLLSTLKLGFSQVVKSEKIKKYLYNGSLMHKEQATDLGKLLVDENLPVAIPFDFHVTDSKHSPFSDKLMLAHSTVVTAFCLIEAGFGLTNTARKDIITTLTNIIAAILADSKDGTDLMIENGWLERVPETANRSELIQ